LVNFVGLFVFNLHLNSGMNLFAFSRIYLLMMLVAYAAIFPWQIVGLLRSTARYAKEKRKGIKKKLIVSVVLLLVIFELGIIIWTPFLVRQTLVDRFEYSFTLPKEGNYSITFIDDAILVKGVFKKGMSKRLRKILKEHPKAKVIILDSGGGSVSEAKKIFKIISNNKLNTYVENYCASACIDAFLAGEKRSISSKAKLGFHQSTPAALSRDHTIPELMKVLKRDIKFLHKQGVSKEFASKAFEAKPKDMWYPSHQELLEAGVVHEVKKGR